MHKYKKIKKVGEGAHGVVFKAAVLPEYQSQVFSPHGTYSATDDDEKTSMDSTSTTESKFVAIKKIRMKSSQEGLSQEAIREIKLLQELKHPHIMPVYDIFNHHSNINIVIEFMDHDLEDIVKSQKIILLPADIKAYMRMLLLSVEHCHKNWILHRDLKPGNCLIGTDGKLKLADFGLAKIFGSPTRQLSPQACTLWYRAPEMLYGARYYGAGTDMWAVGCIFAELMLRVPFFPGSSEIDQLSRIFAGLGTPDEKAWPGMTELPAYHEFTPTPAPPLQEIFKAAPLGALDLLKGLLTYNPSKRLSATQALNHTYFTQSPAPTPCNQLPKMNR